MKQIILFLSLFCLPLMVASQVKLSTDFDVKLGEPYKVVDASSKKYFSVGNDKTLSVKTDKETVYIQLYSFTKAGAKETARKEYKKELPKGSTMVDIIQTKDKLIYIYDQYDSKAKSFSVYSREISTTQGTFGTAKKLFNTSGKVHRPFANPADVININSVWDFGLTPRFEVVTSFNKEKILIRYRNVPASKKDTENYDVLGFYVFDQDMKKELGKEVKMPYTEAAMNNLAFGLLSNGTAFMLAQRMPTKDVELFTISGDGKLTTKKIDISNEYNFMKLVLNEDASGNLVCGGLYSQGGMNMKLSFNPFSGMTGGASYTTNGLIYFKMDESGEILAKQDYEFPLEIIQQYISDRLKERAEKLEEKGKAGEEDLKLVNMVKQADGSTVFVCEVQYARNEMWGTDTKTVYHFRNMIIMKINADGSLAWIKKIPKDQAGVNGKGQMSVKYISGGGYHYIIYVDNPKNLNISVDDAPKTHKDGLGGFLTACKIDDATGKYEKHTVLEMEDIEGKSAEQFSVTRIYEANIDSQIFMMEAYLKGKKDAMIKIELKK